MSANDPKRTRHIDELGHSNDPAYEILIGILIRAMVWGLLPISKHDL